jgi:hypothetical protein
MPVEKGAKRSVSPEANRGGEPEGGDPHAALGARVRTGGRLRMHVVLRLTACLWRSGAMIGTKDSRGCNHIPYRTNLEDWSLPSVMQQRAGTAWLHAFEWARSAWCRRLCVLLLH